MANISSDNLLREVDEELRRDRLRTFWRRYGAYVIGAAVAIVLGVAAYEGWNWWQRTQSSASSDKFYAAMDLTNGTDLDAARKALDDVIATSSGGYPMLAQFREAALLAQQKKVDEAVAAYDALATSQSNPHLRDLALVLAAGLLVDKGDVAAVQQRVSGVLDPSNPLHNAAHEVLGLTQYKAGQLNDALATFQQILADPFTDRELSGRMQLFVSELISEGAKAPAAPDTSSSAPAEASSSEAAQASSSGAAESSEPMASSAAPSSEPVASSAPSSEAVAPSASSAP